MCYWIKDKKCYGNSLVLCFFLDASKLVNGHCGNCIYNYLLYGCCESVVSIAGICKARDLHAFDRIQVIDSRYMVHSIAKISRELGFSYSTVSRVCREYTDGRKNYQLGKIQMAISLERARKYTTQTYFRKPTTSNII